MVRDACYDAESCGKVMNLNLGLASSKWVPLSNGKDKAVKGEEWAVPPICCAQDTMGPLTPTAPMTTWLWETFTLLRYF